LFAENHSKAFLRQSQSQGVSGVILRQFWTFFALILVAAFSSILRASLTLQESPPGIQSNQEAMESDRPVILVLANEEEYKSLETSHSAFDRWLFKAAQSVYYWGRYLLY